MRLKRFSVKGYKNFQQEIVLDSMGAICVIHGENNVGKSNLLEAMQLFFQFFHPPFKFSEKIELNADELARLGFQFAEIFNFGQDNPIMMTAILAFDSNDIIKIESEKAFEIKINFQLKKANNHHVIVVNEIEEGEQGIDIFAETKSWVEEVVFDPSTAQEVLADQFALIGVDRRINEAEMETVRNIVPQSLLLKLYDVKDSPEPAIFEKWELFVRTLQRFNDVLGEGEFLSTFDRHTNRAKLMFQPQSKPRRRIPIEILGSGIQQVIALVARLLVSDATFVAIEEPELNLRYTLQLRLRDILQEIVEAPVGPQQIFLSSHSPAFEFGPHFYAMQIGSEGPIVKHRPIQEANHFTQHCADAPENNENAPMGYVSSDGLVKLPEFVRQELSIEQGGGVVFVKRADSGHIELLTNNQFIDLFEPVENEIQ